MISDKKNFKELMERHPLADKFFKELFKKVDVHLPKNEFMDDANRVSMKLLEEYHDELSETRYDELLDDIEEFNEELLTKCDIFEAEIFLKEHFDIK